MKRQTFGRPSDKTNPVHKIQQLREFVAGIGSWGEDDLTDCLKQCGYNLERAAEMLITGQYKRGNSFLKMNSSPSRSNSATKKQAPIFKAAPTSTPFAKTVVPKSQFTLKPTPSSPTRITSTTPTQIVNTGDWLLCQRWLSDAVCTTKHGRIDYKEPLQLTFDSSGRSTVRFRGRNIEGHLPENIAAILTPILRHDQNLLHLAAEGLMEDRGMPIGRQLPISISVYLRNPRAFFQIFDSEDATMKTSMYFQSKQKYGKKKLPLIEAAFQLLQWAEYGDVPEFKPPSADKTDEEESSDDGIEMNEDDFEDASVAESTAEAKEWSAAIHQNTDWTSSLPECEDPEGFTKGVSLRPYQKQALYWMSKRENDGESKEELIEQLSLMSELAEGPKKSYSHVTNTGKDIFCECGPVVLSEKAKKESKTIDGQVDPVNHPLWKRRFLASSDMRESLSFYVNEVLGIATHSPPEPPKPCSGGLLSDAMGLGKTVMLLALILKSKRERRDAGVNGPGATLVVAKLSLLAQWEDELKCKTSLTHRVYYQNSSRGLTTGELENVDVVVTTYGQIQSELTRKNQTLLNANWLRVILDEAHCIRNPQTLASKAACALNAKHRWCVSGTIIQNSLDDIFGVMKFLRHEPWCLPSFWKTAITKPAQSTTGNTSESEKTGLQVALDRLRRVLTPIMIRRTKDSLTKDGKPILTLPPVETKIIKVELSESEREFYNAVHAKSMEVFDGFVEAGTAASSYFQIFSLLQRLRQTCDHIALTVKNRMVIREDFEDQEDSKEAANDPEDVPDGKDGLVENFMNDLLSKFAAKSSPRKKPTDGKTQSPSPKKKLKDNAFLSQVALNLSHAVEGNESHISQECPVCLETIKIEEAVLTPCAHIFCRDCLVGCLREKAEKTEVESKMMTNLRCPDGPCPCCNVKVEAKRIVALSKSEDGVTTNFLTSAKPTTTSHRPFLNVKQVKDVDRNNFARQTLENAISGSPSSKMLAIIGELESIWQMDPGSKVLIFSQYLGFLDLLQGHFRREGVPYFRLDGSCSLKQRMSILEEFRSTDSRVIGKENEPSRKRGSVLLMSMSAGAEGLNLVSASSVFIVDPWWNAAKEDQCINRIHRIGQTADLVRVRKFVVSDSVEERILELQSRKKYVAEEIYNDAGRETEVGGGKLSMDEFRLIFHK